MMAGNIWRRVVTDLDTVYIDYQTSVDESKMPNYFVQLLRTAFAAEIAITITDQATKADYFRGLAFGTPSENGRGGLFVSLCHRQPWLLPQIIEDYALIAVR